MIHRQGGYHKWTMTQRQGREVITDKTRQKGYHKVNNEKGRRQERSSNTTRTRQGDHHRVKHYKYCKAFVRVSVFQCLIVIGNKYAYWKGWLLQKTACCRQVEVAIEQKYRSLPEIPPRTVHSVSKQGQQIHDQFTKVRPPLICLHTSRTIPTLGSVRFRQIIIW